MYEGDCFTIGQLEIRVLETPGHTDDHLAYAVFDSTYPDKAVGVFIGDALFVGDVIRPVIKHWCSGHSPPKHQPF